MSLDLLQLICKLEPYLDHESLDFVLDGSDLAHQITGLVGGDASGDHRARDTGRTAQGELAWDVDEGNVLVLAKKRKVKQNSKRRSISRKDNELGSTTVEGLGS